MTNNKQGARSRERGASRKSARTSRPLPSDLQPTAYSLQPARLRRAISLLEVLIAMFVMLFGLMGVAAIFPVGNHYAGKSDQYDRGAALAGSAFAELKARGLMRPEFWRYPDNSFVMDASGAFALGLGDAGHAFVIDPLGAAETDNSYFPFNGGSTGTPAPPNEWLNPPSGNPGIVGTGWPIRRVTLAPVPGGIKMGPQVASSIFRLRDDVSVALPDENDHPGIQRWAVDTNGTDFPGDDIPLARDYAGSYSWLATVLPVDAAALAALQPIDPRHGDALYEVSVAVFYKREDEPSAASERVLEAELGPGGDLELIGTSVGQVDDASQDIRPGQWIALCGVHPTSGKFLLRWYRLLSLDDETTEEMHGAHAAVPHRDAMVEGPDWPQAASAAPGAPVEDLRAILLPGVIGVATQTIKLETE